MLFALIIQRRTNTGFTLTFLRRTSPVQGAEGLRRSCGIDEKVFQPPGEEPRAPCLGTRHHRCTTYDIYDFARFVQTLERARVIQASWRRASSPLWAFGFFWWWS